MRYDYSPCTVQILYSLSCVQLISDDNAEIHYFFVNALLKTRARV